ncbi:hypothetical protein AOQ89_00640 [bacterium endosymbiont of Pedicinus badii]|nr:hypothetical protein AOQ89_00640 [bacterium endosymbiont of Pedicinus badii]
MKNIHLKNSSSFKKVFESLDKKIKKMYVAAKINENFIYFSENLKKNSKIKIITYLEKEGIKIANYFYAYLLGFALKKTFPNIKRRIFGIEEKKFFYEFSFDKKIEKKYCLTLEQEMQKIFLENAFYIKKFSLKEAINFFSEKKEEHKIEYIKKYFLKKNSIFLIFYKNFAEIAKIPCILENKKFYFKIKKIKFVSQEKNKKKKFIQKILGKVYIDRYHKENNSIIEERDHRKIAKILDLYHIEETSPGMIFWHDNGWTIFKELKKLIREKLKKFSYQEVKCSFMTDKKIWETTGHWKNYKKYIFTTNLEKKVYCIKPMNCPSHAQIFKNKIRSYKDLPLRIAEFGNCHRNEPSGSLHGLFRTRCFTQDDGHIFCTIEQSEKEISDCIQMIYETYKIFNFKNIEVKLSTRPKNRVGKEEIWEIAEKKLKFVLEKNKISFSDQIGEGAFYGPKIEFILLDSLNREWQCGTIQLDFFLPKYLNVNYIDKNNEKKNPVMIHRAILGSIERFIGIITEEYYGKYPVWISPVQVVVISISSKYDKYVKYVENELNFHNIRVKTDLRNENLNFKIRENILLRIPYIIICGKKESSTNTISIRKRNEKEIKNLQIKEFLKMVELEILYKR